MCVVYVCTSPESAEQSHVGSSIVQDPFCAPWPGTTDSNRAVTEAELQEKDVEIERLQQELEELKVRSIESVTVFSYDN